MRMFFHGTDRGNATITAMVLITVLSSAFIAFTARLGAAERFAAEYKASVVAAILESNREVLSRYDFH
ncbi:MAG: hypothetical protein LBQ94_08370 [Treponema sp.]|nr:hypothetical protein [Treponema sp.]